MSLVLPRIPARFPALYVSALIACAAATTSLAAPLPTLLPALQPDRATKTPEGTPPAGAHFRDHLASLLNDLRADQTRLEQAIQKLDAGASLDEVRDSLAGHLGVRSRFDNEAREIRPGRDAERGGEWGGDRGGDRGGERGGGPPGPGGRSDQPFSDDDWQAVHAIITHARPEMLQRFDELRQKDPAGAQRLTLAAYPRLRPLLDLYRHDRAAFDLRLQEMTIIRESLPLAKAVIELREQGKPDDSPEMKAAREKLRDLAGRHAETRLAIQRAELESLRRRLERREKELEEQVTNPDLALERSIDGLIKQAERGEPGSRRRGAGPRPDGPPHDGPSRDGPSHNGPPREGPRDEPKPASDRRDD